MPHIVVIGGGPAGLAAAGELAGRGCTVTVLERMPTVGRKILMAGRGGLNLTHSEPFDRFVTRYGPARPWLEPALRAFAPDDLRHWAEDLGQPCFTGSSGRVFPQAMKASPLLRAWVARLTGLGVNIRTRHDWTGWNAAGRVTFTGPDGAGAMSADAVILAMGGASWPRLGSDGQWTRLLAQQGVIAAPFQAANCGFATNWTEATRTRFAGKPLRGIALTMEGASGAPVRGEAVVTAAGLEGGAIYALSAPLRDRIAAQGQARVLLDLRPDMSLDVVQARLERVRGRESLSNTLRKALRLPPVAVAILREGADGAPPRDTAELARLVKAVPVTLLAPDSLDRAISVAGGIRAADVDARFMLRALPGVFAAGEMLDWEAPTGGYLLQACFATGRAAAAGVLDWLQEGAKERYPSTS
ncbi:TIGR03862 family flavoprotein [Gluconacetobacter azotocaptans]|uniref:TIGR03862 family flavoprotein n=1 Tax=Gluconacetobacter azotocaptans TaxID=142834 RepID=UPI00195A43E3|nr:TIGR03862 family flavoprotein [Gluconacetobacter azotocaptans]MBM9403589.1 TIGR03862 family flavoprotein [Gluconacetobacter azotocaptans]